MTVTTASMSPLLDPPLENTPTGSAELRLVDELRLADELHRALAELADAEDAERRREGAPELLEARSLRAANAVIGARLALRRLHACLSGALPLHDEQRAAADLAVLALAPRGTSPRSTSVRRTLSRPGRSRR